MLSAQFSQLQAYLDSQVIGQTTLTQNILVALLADGHLLVEGPPGLAKTRAVNSLANGVEGDFHRVQFTPDLLPADLTGTDIYRPETGQFDFQKGPLFHNLVLADEINRAPAKVQSALLEAMAERQITVGNKTYPLPELFLVMATQNPIEQEGTYPLPEAQLDRFLMRLSIGYPDASSEKKLLAGQDTKQILNALSTALSCEQLLSLQQQCPNVHVAEPLIAYVQALLEFSRTSPLFSQGLSPRGGIGLVQSAKAWALMDGRDSVYPEDIQAVLSATTEHRLVLQDYTTRGQSASHVLLTEVAIP